LWLSLGGDSFEEGLRLFRAGQYKESLEAFRKASEESGDDAPAELLFDRALAALATDDLTDAEQAAERAAARDALGFGRARDFLRGNVAFASCEAAEKAIASPPAGPAVAPPGSAPGAPPEPNPGAYDKPIALAESARDAWIAAASAGEDWPAARRNVERALRKIEELKKKKEEEQKKKDEQDKQKEQDKKSESRPESQPESRPSDPNQQKQDPNKDQKQPQDSKDKEKKPSQQKPQEQKELSPEQVQRMLDKLDEKEKQRVQLQRARAWSVRVPKDW
jgi:hypothetical protein